MKRKFLSFLIVGFIAFSCENNVEENSDEIISDEKTEQNEEAEESELAFDGVDKGDYLLYGHVDVDPTETATIDEMLTEFDGTGNFNRKVEITINEVCQKAGCWINFNTTAGDNIMVFFRDHFTIPIESSLGKDAILYGSLVPDTLDVDFQKHLLDDAKEAGEKVTQAEYDAITEDKIELTFDCEAILIKK